MALDLTGSKTLALVQDLVGRVNLLTVKVNVLMSTQDDLQAKVDRLNAAVAAIRARIDALVAANVPVDLTSLEAAVADAESVAAG